MNYKDKYIKYKNKYLQLNTFNNQLGGYPDFFYNKTLTYENAIEALHKYKNFNPTLVQKIKVSNISQLKSDEIKIFTNLKSVIFHNNFTAGTILNDTIYVKKNNLNTRYKNSVISANVNLASININTYEPS